MLTVDISLPDVEELVRLAEQGVERGVLTYDEVAAVLDEVELSKEQVEDFHAYLLEHGVELVEADGVREPEAVAERTAPVLDLTVEPSLDSLRLYLRGHRPRVAADGRAGGVAREAHRARRHASPSGP